MPVFDVGDIEQIAAQVDFVFCALSTDKGTTHVIEEAYARRETAIISACSIVFSICAARACTDASSYVRRLQPASAGT
jgi:hypothetical protein|tara:strand:- start:55 stop:288 length:234 start_codon:yes stop_codon:yes gene_type:complete